MKLSSLLLPMFGVLLLVTQFACDPPQIDPKPTPTPGPVSSGTVGIVTGIDEFRTWADGSYACSCAEYRQPTGGIYVYSGSAAGSGLYRIQPKNSSAPIDVYCDMATDGGGWTLVLLNSGFNTSPTPGWLAAIRENNVTGTMPMGLENGYDQLLGLKYWESLGSTLRVEVGTNSGSLSHRAL